MFGVSLLTGVFVSEALRCMYWRRVRQIRRVDLGFSLEVVAPCTCNSTNNPPHSFNQESA